MSLVTQRMFSVTVAIATAVGQTPVPVPGVFDKFSGGENEADQSQYSAGGMADPEALPGVVKTSEITVSRGYRGERDAPLEAWLDGKENLDAIVKRQALNPDKTPIPGGLRTFRGVFKGATTPEHDSEGSTVTQLALKFTVSGRPVSS